MGNYPAGNRGMYVFPEGRSVIGHIKIENPEPLLIRHPERSEGSTTTHIADENVDPSLRSG
jgi:hypothetical protein